MFGTYVFHLYHSATTRGGTNVDQQDFSHLDMVDLVVLTTLVIFCAHNSLEESSFYVDFNEDLGHCVRVSNNHTNHIV